MTIKLDPNPVALNYPSLPRKDMGSAHRLIVLVPANINSSTATQQIWELANATGMQIQLLGLCKDAGEESRLRRDLISMASLLEEGRICAEAKVEIGTNWLEALKTNYKTGDRIICFAEEHAGFLRKPLNEVLESKFNAAVYLLSGPTLQTSKESKRSQISTWLVSLAVIIGFGALQAKIVQLPAGWFQNTLLILSLIPEFWLIWVWDGLLN